MVPILATLLFGSMPPADPLSCATPTADLGEARSGPPLVHTFALRPAAADGVVTILGVETGCGCVRKDLSQPVLHAGEHADLTLTINTLTQPAGPGAWRAVVRYRHAPASGPPTDHQLDLTVRATVVREIEVSPPELAFSTSGAARQTVTVTDRRGRPLTVTNATTTAPTLTAAVRPPAVTADGRSQDVEVAVAADAPSGEWAGVVTLTTDDPACPQLRLPVRVRKAAAQAVTATPAALGLRFAPGQKALSAMVLLRAGGEPIAVRAVGCDHPAVTTAYSAAGPVATVRVTVATPSEPGRATVRVVLAEPDGEAVTVPITWEAR